MIVLNIFSTCIENHIIKCRVGLLFLLLNLVMFLKSISGWFITLCPTEHLAHSENHSFVPNSAILWMVAHQAPLFKRFSRQEYWNGLPFPSPGDLPDPGIEPRSPALQADSLPSEPPEWVDEWMSEQVSGWVFICIASLISLGVVADQRVPTGGEKLEAYSTGALGKWPVGNPRGISFHS